jgi:hypothetical protein
MSAFKLTIRDLLAASAILSMVMGIDCAGSQATRTAAASTAVRLAGVTPSPSPTWPSYRATDYGKPGQPSLTATQVARIRFILSQVKLCQRPLLRYAFPRDHYKSLVVFFEPRGFDSPGTISFSHVIGEGFAWYAPSVGETRVGPIGADDTTADMVRKFGVQYDVENEPCIAVQ